MPYKPVDEKTIGIHFEDNTLLAAFVSSEKGNLQIKKLFEIPLSPEGDEPVKLLYNDPELKKILDRHLIVSGLPASDVLVRRMRLKLTQEDDIDAAFEFQAEPQLPYSIDEAVLDKILIEKQETGSQIVFLAAKKEQIQAHLSFCQNLNIDPEMVLAEPIALSNLLFFTSDLQLAEFAVHIGKNATLCILIKDKKLIASHEIQEGWESLYEGLLSDTPEVTVDEFFALDIETLAMEDYHHFFKALETLQKGILWNYMALMKETKCKETPLLYVTGQGANLAHFPELLAIDLGINLGSFNIPSHSCTLQDFHRFALPIGLAFSAQPQSPRLH